jgi:hypothetical protein
MSRGPWKSKPAKEAERLIATAEARGYEITSIEITNDAVRVGVQRPGGADRKTEAEELRKNL